jgi:hypothetical protein
MRRVSLRRLLSPWHRRAYFLAKAEGGVTPYMIERLCAAIDRDPDELYGVGFQDAPIVLPPADQPDEPRLDAAPLVEAIEARIRRRVEGDVLAPDMARGEAMAALFGSADALKRTFYRARECDSMTLETAEQLCDGFGWHPRMIWGDAYDAAALVGLDENTDLWEGAAA